MLTRREIITGLVSFAVAPAIVKIENIMPVKSFIIDDYEEISLKLIKAYEPLHKQSEFGMIFYTMTKEEFNKIYFHILKID